MSHAFELTAWQIIADDRDWELTKRREHGYPTHIGQRPGFPFFVRFAYYALSDAPGATIVGEAIFLPHEQAARLLSFTNQDSLLNDDQTEIANDRRSIFGLRYLIGRMQRHLALINPGLSQDDQDMTLVASVVNALASLGVSQTDVLDILSGRRVAPDGPGTAQPDRGDLVDL